MKLPSTFNGESQCFYNHHNGYHYFVSPFQGQWDVIESPSTPDRWNMDNISLAVVKDLRAANFIVYTFSQVKEPKEERYRKIEPNFAAICQETLKGVQKILRKRKP
jgi:hypothetical protein